MEIQGTKWGTKEQGEVTDGMQSQSREDVSQCSLHIVTNTWSRQPCATEPKMLVSFWKSTLHFKKSMVMHQLWWKECVGRPSTSSICFSLRVQVKDIHNCPDGWDIQLDVWLKLWFDSCGWAIWNQTVSVLSHDRHSSNPTKWRGGIATSCRLNYWICNAPTSSQKLICVHQRCRAYSLVQFLWHLGWSDSHRE